LSPQESAIIDIVQNPYPRLAVNYFAKQLNGPATVDFTKIDIHGAYASPISGLYL
jgi:hypothetical protein